MNCLVLPPSLLLLFIIPDRPLRKPSRALVTTVETAAFTPAAKPTAGFRCRLPVQAAAQLGNNVNLGISVDGNIGKGRGNDESHTHRHTHIGDKGSQTVIRSGGTTLKGAQMIGKDIRADSRNPSQSVHRNGNRHRRLFRQPTLKSINVWTVKKQLEKSEIS